MIDNKLSRLLSARLVYYKLLKENTLKKADLYRQLRAQAMKFSEELEGLTNLAEADNDFYKAKCRKSDINFNVWDSRLRSTERDIRKVEKSIQTVRSELLK